MTEAFASKTKVGADGCVLWTASTVSSGYGQFWHERKKWLVHRLAYTWAKGEIPPNLTVDHLCKQRLCVNPAHMEIVTRGENAARGGGGAAIAAIKRAQTHCKHGHEFTPDNTKTWNGKRQCRACHKRIVAAAKRKYGN